MITAVEKSDNTMMCCASCGTAEGDDIKLKYCRACYLVRYCSVKCQKEHRPQHKKECKKRAAEMKDEILFKQPESSHEGDCPICCLPLPIGPLESVLNPCCSKYICKGCNHANKKRLLEERLQNTCPFCRKAIPKSTEEAIEQLMKRIEANDPVAMCQVGTMRCLDGDYKTGLDYFTRAAALGDGLAHRQLSVMYRNGEGVEKEKKRALHHTEQAAIGGHPGARYNLGLEELKNGRVERAAKHYIIAAKLGDDDSMERVKDLYKDGIVGKDDFAAALRGYHAAIEATKSPQREEALKLGSGSGFITKGG